MKQMIYEKKKPTPGQLVHIMIDRPMNSYHPEHKELFYPVNYGYIEGIIAPDGEEQDVYVLGIDHPVKEFTGKVIAIIHRLNDVEDKWVAVPEDMAVHPATRSSPAHRSPVPPVPRQHSRTEPSPAWSSPPRGLFLAPGIR